MATYLGDVNMSNMFEVFRILVIVSQAGTTLTHHLNAMDSSVGMTVILTGEVLRITCGFLIASPYNSNVPGRCQHVRHVLPIAQPGNCTPSGSRPKRPDGFRAAIAGATGRVKTGH